MGIMNFYLSTKLDDLYMIAAIHFVETCATPFQDFGYLCWWACICFSLFVFWLATTVFLLLAWWIEATLCNLSRVN
jgi:hypothetical protein